MDASTQLQSVLAEYGDRIYRICCCYVGDADERQDVYQATLIHLWESLGTFAGRSSLGTWVYRVTVNTCLHHLRTEARRHRAVAVAERELGPELEGCPAAGGADDAAAAVARLHGCIQQLPPVDRLLVSLHLEDASTSEMAAVLGISAANVRVKLHRARKALKHIWEETEDGTR